jgi:NADPH:quinone reductase
MIAIRVHKTGGPEVLRLENVPDPEPGPGELVIEVLAIGVNYIEIYQREGQYTLPKPFTPGGEAAGSVRAIGDGVEGFRIGDQVVTQRARGAYATRVVVAAEHAVRLPPGVTPKLAAAVFLQGLTAHYLSTSTYALQTGDRCLVHAAAGGVGLLLCQMARMRGALAIGTASTEEKLALAREAGAVHVINYREKDFATEVKSVTNGAGVPVVYDSVGRTTFEGSLDCLRKRGTMVLFGQSSGAVPAVDPQLLNRKGSLFLTRPTLNDYVATRAELLERSGELLAWVGEGRLSVRIGLELPLVRAADAHRALASRKTAGKVILVP